MNYHRIISPRTEIFWAGWRSDTIALQRAGWDLSAEQDYASYGFRIRLAMRSPYGQMYGISAPYEGRHLYNRSMNQYASDTPNFIEPIIIQQMASSIRLNMMDTTSLDGFRPIDAEPVICTNRIERIEDMNIFKTIGNCQEIIIPEKSVSEALNEILEKQAPYQKELREKKRREYRRFQSQLDKMTADYMKEHDPRRDIVAQLITI